MNPTETITTIDPWTLGIVSGLISSITATILMLLFGEFWKNTIIPNYRRTFYKGVKLEDIWTNELKISDSHLVKGTLELKQSGDELSGKMFIQTKIGSNENLYNYKIKGEIVNNYIKMTASASDEKNFTFSCGIFEIKGNGKILEGATVIIDNITSDIIPHDKVIWIRN